MAQNQGHPNGSAGLKGHDGDPVTILAVPRDGVATLPAGYPLDRALFEPRDTMLRVIARGYPDAVIPGFFAPGGPTVLATADGGRLSRSTVLLIAKMSTRLALALEGVGRANEG